MKWVRHISRSWRPGLVEDRISRGLSAQGRGYGAFEIDDDAVALLQSYNVDFDGATRPQGSAWEIGAYETGTIFVDDFESGDSVPWSRTIP